MTTRGDIEKAGRHLHEALQTRWHCEFCGVEKRGDWWAGFGIGVCAGVLLLAMVMAGAVWGALVGM